jgi:hypothetical protein
MKSAESLRDSHVHMPGRACLPEGPEGALQARGAPRAGANSFKSGFNKVCMMFSISSEKLGKRIISVGNISAPLSSPASH